MTATDELRRMLDERGVEWRDSSDENVLHTTWSDMNCWFNEFPDGWTSWGMSMRGTPEQAIAATLGREMLTADDVRDLIERHSDATGGNGRDFHNGAYVAIADELNATLGSSNCTNDCTNSERTGTCRNVAEPDEYSDRPFTCSECGARGPMGNGTYHMASSWAMEDGTHVFADSWPVWKYCPNCGRKVVTNG